MSDKPVVHIGENSPEQVAFKLLEKIADVEGRVFHRQPSGQSQTATREWILKTYAEVLRVVKAPQNYTG